VSHQCPTSVGAAAPYLVLAFLGLAIVSYWLGVLIDWAAGKLRRHP